MKERDLLTLLPPEPATLCRMFTRIESTVLEENLLVGKVVMIRMVVGVDDSFLDKMSLQ